MIIKGYDVEFIEETHTYLINGVIVPSITQLLKKKFGGKYKYVNSDLLKKSAELGTKTHKAIEDYCRYGIEDDSKELRNFKFLQKHYNFSVKDNEVTVILFKEDKPISAGRLDLVLEIDGKIGGGDIKRTSTLDKEYLAYQLNLYRIAYKQCYGVEWEFLKGIQLKENKRKFVNIPINEDIVWELIAMAL